MKSNSYKYLSIICLLIGTVINVYGQQPQSTTLQSNPWTSTQLLPPSALMTMMKTGKVLLYNIGVAEDIQGSIPIGAASKAEKLALFITAIKSTPKDKTVVIYCGCCPMDKCPNIRPAFQALKNEKITKAYLLYLPTNLKTDWTGKGFPLAKTQVPGGSSK